MTGFRPRFFVTQAETCACGAELALGAEDCHHAVRVLRLQRGDECEVVVVTAGAAPDGAVSEDAAPDGAGGETAAGRAAVYAATVCDTARPVIVRLTSRLEGVEAGACYQRRVGVVQALGRPAAMEYVLEKGTEVGASFFQFVPTEGSPRGLDLSRGDRLDRWRRIVREAAKQSKQVAIPSLEVLGSLDAAIEASRAAGTLALVLEPEAPQGLHEVLAAKGRHLQGDACVALWIGPEGGWAGHEMERFSAAGMGCAGLGRSVLRTETAGPVAVAVARLALGDW